VHPPLPTSPGSTSTSASGRAGAGKTLAPATAAENSDGRGLNRLELRSDQGGDDAGRRQEKGPLHAVEARIELVEPSLHLGSQPANVRFDAVKAVVDLLEALINLLKRSSTRSKRSSIRSLNASSRSTVQFTRIASMPPVCLG
jgi:hypothetical protein